MGYFFGLGAVISTLAALAAGLLPVRGARNVHADGPCDGCSRGPAATQHGPGRSTPPRVWGAR